MIAVDTTEYGMLNSNPQIPNSWDGLEFLNGFPAIKHEFSFDFHYRESASEHIIQLLPTILTTYFGIYAIWTTTEHYALHTPSPCSISGLTPKPQVDSHLCFCWNLKRPTRTPKLTGHTLVGRGSSFPAWINWNSGLTKTRYDDSPSLLGVLLLCVCALALALSH